MNLYPTEIVALLSVGDKTQQELHRIRVETIRYCLGNTDYMWAAKMISIVLNCDFRDAKEKGESYLRYAEAEEKANG